ncbi:hypothetical protein OG897_39605 [Streptomyces sp. NBC_00237]|uniref:hypothetical protein n=1 Tax=Streptomyces sp. NBC_00237 TaxID=2975687 RepID=UPI00224CF25C|nr:hypothetical protein [Streptomyces sp. NBC_00237]MCX5207497.1 hypothetical protein [Streptomyces sp. NBC_00237]
MTTSVTIASDVIDQVGLDQAAQFQSRITAFECVECGTAGDARTEPAVVVLRRSPGLSHLGVAHHRCADSQVRDYGPGALALTEETELVPRAIGLPTVDGTKPALLLAFVEQVAVTEGGQTYDPVVRQLVSEGLHELPGLGKAAPDSPGWRIALGSEGLVRVQSEARVHLRGYVVVPPPWLRLAAPARAVTLLFGSLSHEDIYADQPPYRAYAAALRDGRMVGGTVRLETGVGAS